MLKMNIKLVFLYDLNMRNRPDCYLPLFLNHIVVSLFNGRYLYESHL